MKKCNTCKQNLPLEKFSKSKNRCKVCCRLYYHQTKERQVAYSREYREKQNTQFYVYLIVNTSNQKVYVGSTCKKNRFAKHILNSKNSKYEHRPMYQDFHSFGIDCFEFTPLLKFKSKEEALAFEKQSIQLLSSKNYDLYNKHYA